MPIITPGDLGTNIYAEIIDEITRGDNTIAERAIDASISEVKLYLGKYDLVALFGSEETPPSITDELLRCLVKDVACWHLLRLANPNTDYTVYRTAYTDAISILKNIMSGGANPEGWPYAVAATDPLPEGNAISWNSNVKRGNYY